MSGNIFGTLFKLTTFGESHGPAIGGVIDGCPAGVNIDLEAIQKDELVHHGMAKKFYESKFPAAKLQIAFKREKMKNKLRMFYFRNLRFLTKIFDPILNFIITVFGKIVNFISIPDKDKRNLMSSNSNSVV